VPRRRNSDSGQYEEVYGTEDIVDLLRDSRLGTSEVADELGCHRTTAHERLHELKQGGIVTCERVGNTQMWSLSRNEDSE
jgi:DNA-binding Lrp family transcriptional regulator